MVQRRHQAALRGLREGGVVLLACDISDEFTRIGRPFWQQAGVEHKIELVLAPALQTLDARLAAGEAGGYDFAFIDADKSNYDAYYERCLALVRPGGLIALDNSCGAVPSRARPRTAMPTPPPCRRSTPSCSATSASTTRC